MSDESKLRDLQSQIDALKKSHAHATGADIPNGSANAANISAGVKAGTELVGPIIGGGLIGYGLDHWFGTNPWLLIGFVLLGIVTGFLNVWKTTQSVSNVTPTKKSDNT